MEIITIIQTFLSGIVTLVGGILLATYNRSQKRRDESAAKQEERTERRAEARKYESLLGLEMQMASAKLSYAVAKAMQDGKTNGEVKEGIAAYEEAKRKYIAFINERAVDSIYK